MITSPSELFHLRQESILANAQGNYGRARELDDEQYDFTVREREELLILRRKIIADGEMDLVPEVDVLIEGNGKALDELCILSQGYGWEEGK